MSLHYPCNNCTITVLPLHSTPTSRSKPQQQNQQHVTMSILTSKSASSTPISKLNFTPTCSTLSYTQTDIYTNIFTPTNLSFKKKSSPTTNNHWIVTVIYTEISAQRFKSSLKFTPKCQIGSPNHHCNMHQNVSQVSMQSAAELCHRISLPISTYIT